VKIRPYFVTYRDTWMLGPTASLDAREFRIGLSFIVCEVGFVFISEALFQYGCGICGKIGEAPVDQLPDGWEKRYRPDKTYYFSCLKCRELHEEDEDYIVTDENREHAIDEIIGQLVGDSIDEVECKALRDYANSLLDESEPFSKNDLSASVAAYSNGFTDAREIAEGQP